MTNIVPASRVSSTPVVIAPDLDRSLSVAFNAVIEEFGDLIIAPERVPTGEVRERLEGRLAKVSAWLRPGGPVSMLDDIGMVITTMGMRGGSSGDFKTIAKIYASDLGDLPTWAVSQACKEFRQGVVGDGKWAPTQAEIRRQAVAHMGRWQDERTKLTKVLDAKPAAVPSSAQRRAQVVQMAKDKLRTIREAGRRAEAERSNDPGRTEEVEVAEETPEQILARSSIQIDSAAADSLRRLYDKSNFDEAAEQFS